MRGITVISLRIVSLVGEVFESFTILRRYDAWSLSRGGRLSDGLFWLVYYILASYFCITEVVKEWLSG